jgi:DNA-binding transcriptional regulator YiaG
MPISSKEIIAIKKAFHKRSTRLTRKNVEAVFYHIYKNNPKITKKELAEYFDVWESTIDHWIKGTRIPAGANKWVFYIILYNNNLIS